MKVKLIILFFQLFILKNIYGLNYNASFSAQYGLTTPSYERIEGGAEFALNFDYFELPFLGFSGGQSSDINYSKIFTGTRLFFFEKISASIKIGYIKTSNNYSSSYYGTDIGFKFKITDTFFVAPFVEYNIEKLSDTRTIYFGIKLKTDLSIKSSEQSDQTNWE